MSGCLTSILVSPASFLRFDPASNNAAVGSK